MVYYRRRSPLPQTRPRFEPYLPSQESGNFYYVRLKTPVGILYKVGFTTLDSVEERLGFARTGDEKFVDRVLLFTRFDNAADIEAAVHRKFLNHSAFGRFSNDPRLPLLGNGQSELYMHDVLKLDPSFTSQQLDETFSLIQVKLTGRRPEPAEPKDPEELRRLQLAREDLENMGAFFLIRMYAKLCRWLAGRKVFGEEQLQAALQAQRDAELLADLRARIDGVRDEERIRIRVRLAKLLENERTARDP